MNKRFLMHFSEDENIEAFAAGWTILNNASSHEILFDMKGQFKGATVAIVQFTLDERAQVFSIARELLPVASGVKIVKAQTAAALTEQMIQQTPNVPKSLLNIDEDDFGDLAEAPVLQELHPAQDYINGVFYYGCTIQDQDKLVSSSGDFFGLAAAGDHKIALLQYEVAMSHLRHETVIECFTGGGDVDVDELYAKIRDYIYKHIYFAETETYDLVTVWVMGTYIFRAFRYYPYLHLNAEKGSGKTLLLELMSQIAFNGILLSQPAASTVIKLIHQCSATLFIDEAEGLSQRQSGGNSQIKQILKTGFAKSGLFYIGEQKYRTYSAKSFAGINDLDDVLADRSITIKMMRMLSAERKELYRENPTTRKLQEEIRAGLYRFGLRFGPTIALDYEAVKPDALYDKLSHLSNRAYDVWVPLYRIVSAFKNTTAQGQAFAALAKLSQQDNSRRRSRDAEENETGMLIEGLSDVLKRIIPANESGDKKFYETDAVYAAMIKEEKIPKNIKLKGFSRLVKRVLDIDSIPKAHPSGTKRMYMIDTKKFDEYKKRYADEPEKTV